MVDQFGKFDKYERAFLRYQKRKRKEKGHILKMKKNLWSYLRSFFHFSPSGKSRVDNRIVDIKAQVKKDLHHKPKKRNEKEEPLPAKDPKKIHTGMKSKKTIKKNRSKYRTKTQSPLKKTLVIIKNLFFLGATVILLGFIAFGIWFTTLEIPDVSNFEQRKISNSTKIYDRTGEILLYDIHENIMRQVVDLEDINIYAKDAIVAIEDHNFYDHNGVVVRSTLRAVLQTLMSRFGLSEEGTAGGSTITQQVVKNTLLNSQQIISRKVKEWVLAYKIEQQLTKDQILEIYLNEAPYGGTVYGIQEASRIFFGTSASELTLGQSAYLAAIPNLPTFYSPYGPNKDLLDDRQRTVLREMKRYGFISDDEYRKALEEEVEFLSREDNSVKALHFVQYVRSYLEEQYGIDLVENGGLKVITTLDYELQEKAEKIINDHIEEVEEDYDATNAALVAIESETGHIITMVGSRDYFDEEIDGNFNVVTAKRQPGSAFKPIAYANLFKEGYLPETFIFDTQTQFSTRCSSTEFTSEGECYSPNNYDNEFKGPISLRNALAQSRNIPAVKVLYLGGIEDTMRLAREMGINSFNRDSNFYGLGLVLGGGEVSLLELTGAYSIFANDGEFNKPVAIISVEDSEGNVLEEYENNDERVLSRNVSRMISSILSDNVARTPLFGSQSFLNFGEQDIAAKTGTTNDNRDAWLIGYHPEVAVGVWTGNNDNSPMRKGSSISGKPWRAYMDEVLAFYDNESFTDYDLPENFDDLPPMIRGEWRGSSEERVYIDNRTGTRANESTPEEFMEEVVLFEPHTILHWIDKENPQELDTSRDDSQYEHWETSVLRYAEEEFQQEYEDSREQFEALEELQENENIFEIEVIGIEDNDVFELSDSEEVSIEFQGVDDDDIQKVDFFVNNLFIDSDGTKPFSMTVDFQNIDNLSYENTLSIVASDNYLNTVSYDLRFVIEDLASVQEDEVDNPEFQEVS